MCGNLAEVDGRAIFNGNSLAQVKGAWPVTGGPWAGSMAVRSRAGWGGAHGLQLGPHRGAGSAPACPLSSAPWPVGAKLGGNWEGGFCVCLVANSTFSGTPWMV